MMPVSAQQSLDLILRIKLMGEARRDIQGVQLKTMTEFATFLKSLYAPAKSAYQFKGELGGIFQAEDKSVLNYANRVKDIGNRFLKHMKSKMKELHMKNSKPNLISLLSIVSFVGYYQKSKIK